MATDPDIGVSDEDISASIEVLLANLPAPVRNFVKSDERKRIALALSQKYNLHVDQAGVFERSFLFMLLGVSDPKEFVADLRETGIPEEAVTGLANDLNEQVFKRLRREEESEEPAPVAPPPPPVPTPAPPPPPPPLEPVRTMSADMTQVQAGYQAPPQPMYAPVQQMQYVPFGYTPVPMQQPGGYWVPVVVPQYQQPGAPMTPPPAPPPPPPPPVAEHVPAYVPPAPPPPPPPPVAEHVPAYVPPPPVPPTPKVERPTAPPLTKEYGVDPYREPVQ